MVVNRVTCNKDNPNNSHNINFRIQPVWCANNNSLQCKQDHNNSRFFRTKWSTRFDSSVPSK
jgi:hypothetical protein